MEKKLLYTRNETAKLLSISVDTLDHLRNDCVIQGYHVARGTPRIYFKAKDLEKFMERLEVAEC
jgi:hypothetical protein